MFLQEQNELKDHFLKFPDQKFRPMIASIDEDVEKSSLADQDDVGTWKWSSSGQNQNRKYRDSSGSKTFDSESITEDERSARYVSTSHSEHVTPSSRSSRSDDHRRSRRYSPEYDRREGRSEPSPRHGKDYRDYDDKRSRYESFRRIPSVLSKIGVKLMSLNVKKSVAVIQTYKRRDIDMNGIM
ncbi:DNA/RNA helicase, DEAD/DEAH box type, N-terminal [Artemisia annua]|uniref:DNA/RNA helicase, DEAD/DEAH box type, N-terminal n=1 Tax=Artemisia annua TaxID=35608 RepID=A0A2U1KXQ5_ARTAN|nr:DNA/RNA helicase, DEAD/DEAH box type, N-terminal [Artemisia annua]